MDLATAMVLKRPSVPRAAIRSTHLRKKGMNRRVTFSTPGHLYIRKTQHVFAAGWEHQGHHRGTTRQGIENWLRADTGARD